MDKLKLGIFEIFTYILPGIFLVLGFYLILHDAADVMSMILTKAASINIGQSVLFLLASYVLGFVNQFVAYELFKVLSIRIWKKRMKKSEISFGKLENEVAQMRHFSPNNFNALNRWFALRGMCYGLFQGILFFDCILFIRALQNNSWPQQTIVFLVLLSIMGVLFLRRAITFHEWAHRTIKYSMKHMGEFKKTAYLNL